MPDFSPQLLLPILQHYPNVRRYWVAFSGGVDSSVLLHAMAQLAPELQSSQLNAIYIDHGLQAESQQWSDHCLSVCEKLGINIISLSAEVRLEQGDSLEEKARESRYLLLADFIDEGDALLTAQHKDDQAETFLLQALRGAGPKGLASMPMAKSFSKGLHLRPLLGFSKQNLISYAKDNNLTWVEDPSNAQMRFQRNYLRQKVFPVVRKTWPSMSDALSRSAEHCAANIGLLNQLADIDMEAVTNTDNTLSRVALNSLLPDRRANLLRYWLSEKNLRVPDQVRLEQIIHQLETSAADKSPMVSWSGAEVRCYRDKVYAMPPLVPVDNKRVFKWQPSEKLEFDGGILSARQVKGAGLRIPEESEIEVRFRQGGERCQPAGQAQSRELKTLFQEWAVPHWLRDRIPLIYVNGKLVAIADFTVCQPYIVSGAGMGWQFDWQSDCRSGWQWSSKR
ncbi:MAG: tRNA lysidine(34) synthetase TilS [Gammaproteobacteria bacterium]|nr:tRNA lysidine(34) synthetase TilS [Gammaproteobacteria bacterium]